MSRDNWSPDARRWGYYADEDDEGEFFEPRAQSPVAREAQPPPSAKDDGPSGARVGYEAVHVAQQMAAGLAAQSGSYPGLAWAVGVHEEAGDAAFYATSNEGTGYLPPGLRWDPRLRHVFGPSVPRTELPLWLGLVNPARILADHYLFLRSARPGLRLTAIVSAQPPGEAVAALLGGLGAAWRAPAESPGRLSPTAVNRLEAVSDGSFAPLIGAIPVRQLWAAGLDLAMDAAERCGYRMLEPRLAAALDGLRVGAAHPAQGDYAWQRLWQLTGQAQINRVPDSRLGSLGPNVASLTFSQAIELGAGFAYIRPFFAARTTAILHTLLRCRLADVPLGEEELAEIAYEHACVAEDTAPARGLLARHSAAEDL